MLSIEIKNEIISKMTQKKIKKKHQKYILKYIELNTELFSYLDIEKLTQRVIENFEGIGFNLTSIIYRDYGQYIPTTGKVLLSANLFFGKYKKYKETVIFHELDHCGCAPITIKQQYNNYKNEIKKKHKIFYKIIPNFIVTEKFLKIYYEGPISGIANLERKKGYTLEKISYGTKLENYLNEGITSLKQKMYSDRLKIPFHKKRDFFKGARIGVECLGNVIGFENLITLHFNNNLKQIEEEFFIKTEIELKELLIKCFRYDQKSSKKRLRDLNKYVEQIYKMTKLD